MVSIPSGIWTKYQEYADFMLTDENFSQIATITYPEKQQACANCVSNPMGSGRGMVNRYRHGGPMPFNFGRCPMCGGSGYKALNATDTLRLRAFWRPADWRRLSVTVVKPESSVVVIGYMGDLPKMKKADTITLLSSHTHYQSWVYQLSGEILPHGFTRGDYFTAVLER